MINILLLALLILLPLTSNPADRKDSTGKENYFVKWIGEFSSFSGVKGEKNVGWKLFNMVVGKKTRALLRPFAVCPKNLQQWVVLDQGLRQVFLVDQHKKEVSPFKTKDSILFPSLVSICIGPDNTIYFTDSQLNRIYYIQDGSREIKVLNKELILEQPTGIAYLASRDEIWVAETRAHRLAVLDLAGRLKRFVGGRGIAPGTFNFPTFLWSDAHGLIYVIDSMNFRVQILNDSGEIITFFGEAGDGKGYFSMPKGIAVDSFGNIYVVDALLHSVQIFDREGNFLFDFGGQGTEPGRFWLPSGIYIDEQNFIYIADTYNGRIQIFRLVSGGND